jgi:hypothetical protein
MADKKETARSGAARWDKYDGSHDSTRWLRVTNRNRCPICRHPSWCRISPDGEIVGCMRVQGSSFKTKSTGAGLMFLHRLSEGYAPSSLLRIGSHRPSVSQSASPWAPIAAAQVGHRHAVYTAMLDALVLSPAHADYLRVEKRLSDETVAQNLYATVPDIEATTKRCTALAAEHDLAAVPGFYREGRRWRFIGKAGELLIPIRDRHEQIAAILRRTGSHPKYRFASSSTLGASCGAPLHYALPHLAELYPEDPIVVTEGALKADSIAEQLHCAVIGVPGVGSLGEIDSQLLGLLAGRQVLIAYDADEQRNPYVRAALVRLVRMLAAAGASVDVLRWSEAAGKGLDDLLTGDAA